MHYAVTLERGTDGGYMAWVHELPGCFARGATHAEVEAKIGPAIWEFRNWLHAGGVRIGKGRVAFTIDGEVETPTAAADADSEILLETDRAPLSPPDWLRMERWLRLSRRDLLRVARQLGPDDLNRRVPGRARTIRQHLVHLAFVEFMYAAWTFDLQSVAGIRDFLQWTRRVARGRMRTLAAARARAVTQAEWSGASRPEPWTARKAARRLLWHERLHLRAIRRLLNGEDV